MAFQFGWARNPDDHASSSARYAVYAQMPLVGLDNLVNDGKTQSGSFVFRGEIGIEYLTQMLRLDAVTRIADGNTRKFLMVVIAAHIQDTAVRHGLNGIQVEIEQALRQAVRIDPNRAQRIGNVHSDPNALVGGILLDQLDRPLDQNGEIDLPAF